MAGSKSASKISGRSGHSLAQFAYDAVRNAIATGDLIPGDRLSIFKIAEWLKISSTPARESLLRLEAEGLLAAHPRRGLVVASIDDVAIQELYQAREVLEGKIAALAALNASGAEIKELKRLIGIEPDLIGDTRAFYEHNQTFHEQIYQAAHNRYLTRALVTLGNIVAAERKSSMQADEIRRRNVVREHRLIVRAIAEGNAEAAYQTMTRHIRSAFDAQMLTRQGLASAGREPAAGT
jgi:DNA-binding GntR family transcriptional regulator